MINTEHWGHDFFVDDGHYCLTVPCGTIAIFDVTIELTDEEFARYQREGIPYIVELADQIRTFPHEWYDRNVTGRHP